MPGIADIIIKKSPLEVWSVIANPASHPHWLSQDIATTYEGDGQLCAGMKFTRHNKQTNAKTEGEIVAISPALFLKVRVDAPQDSFAMTEYHLLAVSEGCAVRVLSELYDTGDTRHIYFPEMIEQQWRTNLQRLKQFCESL